MTFKSVDIRESARLDGMGETNDNASHCLLGGGNLRLRGNCHCHSTFSDGTYPPEETIRRYRDAGYDFLYLTEHCDKLTYGRFPDFDALDSADFRVLPGVEYRNSTVRFGQSRQAMLLGLNTLEIEHWEPGLDQQSTIDAINADGGLAILSCTYWDGRIAGDMADLTGLVGIEIYNATCQGAVGKGSAISHFDELLESGMRLYGLAVDDCHLNDWPDFALAWIVVCAEEKTPTAINDAIRTGRFYSSCGPTIEQWVLGGDTITFRCSPAKMIVCNGVGPYGHALHSNGNGGLTQMTLNLKEQWPGESPYVRFSCCDDQGRWAWTNPFWRDDAAQYV